MAKILMLLPVGASVGLTNASLAITYFLASKRLPFTFLKPIAQPETQIKEEDLTTDLLAIDSKIDTLSPINFQEASQLLRNNQSEKLLEKIVNQIYASVNHDGIVLLEGLTFTTLDYSYVHDINLHIATAVGAEMIYVLNSPQISLLRLTEYLQNISISLSNNIHKQVCGIIVDQLTINPMQKPFIDAQKSYISLNQQPILKINHCAVKRLVQNSRYPVLGFMHEKPFTMSCSVHDLVRYLNAELIVNTNIKNCHLTNVIFSSHNLLPQVYKMQYDTLLVTSQKCLAAVVDAIKLLPSRPTIGAILFTGKLHRVKEIKKLCEHVFAVQVPCFTLNSDAMQIAIKLQYINLALIIDHKERIKYVQMHIAKDLSKNWLALLPGIPLTNTAKLSPPLFCHKIIYLARLANKKIVLPEADEPRTLQAAIMCMQRKTAHCVLLGDRQKIQQTASCMNLSLPENLEILEPSHIEEIYLPRLMELRQHRGMNEEKARIALKNSIVLGTLMLERGDVDGLVAGAVHTTADTIRPALQLIKMQAENSLISSIFFMLLPQQVVIYGDCAINENPTAEQLAKIAIQSAESAINFGLEPRIAMLSYATGNSARGKEVEKVRYATQLVRAQRPDYIIDGPIQYDAASVEYIAQTKAPCSALQGQANIFIFPDLNAGNISYKAVQRNTNILSIGPVLQGLRKPVNDLSRGASVHDIFYTITLTSIQANRS